MQQTHNKTFWKCDSCASMTQTELLDFVFDGEATFLGLIVADFEFVVTVELQHVRSWCISRRCLGVYCVATEFSDSKLFRWCRCTWNHQEVFIRRLWRLITWFCWSQRFHQTILIESFYLCFNWRQVEAIERETAEKEENYCRLWSGISCRCYSLYFGVAQKSTQANGIVQIWWIRTIATIEIEWFDCSFWSSVVLQTSVRCCERQAKENKLKLNKLAEFERIDLPSRSTSLAIARAIDGFIGSNELYSIFPLITDGVPRAHSNWDTRMFHDTKPNDGFFVRSPTFNFSSMTWLRLSRLTKIGM